MFARCGRRRCVCGRYPTPGPTAQSTFKYASLQRCGRCFRWHLLGSVLRSPPRSSLPQRPKAHGAMFGAANEPAPVSCLKAAQAASLRRQPLDPTRVLGGSERLVACDQDLSRRGGIVDARAERNARVGRRLAGQTPTKIEPRERRAKTGRIRTRSAAPRAPASPAPPPAGSPRRFPPTPAASPPDRRASCPG